MAEKYEFDFPRFDIDNFIGKYSNSEAAAFGEAWLAKSNKDTSQYYTVADLVASAKSSKGASDNQIRYLLHIVKECMPAYQQYEKDFFAWYNSRPDIQEVYRSPFLSGETQHVMHPEKGYWVNSHDPDWNQDWATNPANPDMFWRICRDWNVRKFIAVNRDTPYSEGDLVVLRAPFIGNWDYDPLWDRHNMPDKTVMRLGTILEMTDRVHRNSRAGKGSRAVNVLWNGETEAKLIPERVIKLLERKRRTKKKV